MLDSARYAETVQLIHEFWRAMDRDDYDAVLARLTPDAKWKRGPKWRDGQVDIRAALNERPAGLFVRHLISGLVAQPTASGVSAQYLLIANSKRRAEGEQPPFPPALPSVIIDYHVECVVTPEGLRFSKLWGEQVFSSLPKH